MRGNAARLFAENLDARLAGIVIWADGHISLTRLVLEGFLLSILKVSGYSRPAEVPPTPPSRFPQPWGAPGSPRLSFNIQYSIFKNQEFSYCQKIRISYCQKIIAFSKNKSLWPHGLWWNFSSVHPFENGKSTLRIFLVTFCHQNHFFDRKPNVFL